MKSVVIIAIVAVVMIGVLVPSVFAEKMGILCPVKTSDSNYEMIFECTKKLDVNKTVLETMFEDIRWISGAFNQAELYNIEENAGVGTATMRIPIVITSLKSDIKFDKNGSDYKIDFVTGKLAGSKMSVSVSKTNGFDGTPDMGSDVLLKFKIKKKMCFGFSIFKKCGTPNQVMYALDKGLVLLEPKAKIFQDKHPELIITYTSEKISSTTQPVPVITHKEYKEIQISPEVKKVEKEFDKVIKLETNDEYFPEEIELLPSLPPTPVTDCSNITSGQDLLKCKGIILQTNQSVYRYGGDIDITTIVNYKNGQPLFLEFYNQYHKLVFSEKVYPDSNGIFKKSYSMGNDIPAVFHDKFNIYATYGNDKVSVEIQLSNFGTVIELDQKVYSINDSVYITIVSPDHNFDFNSVDTIGNDEDSTITISTDRGYLSNYKLVETGKDTGIFVGEITLVNDGRATTETLANYAEDELQVWMKVHFVSTVATALIRPNIGEISWLDNDENYMDLTNSYMSDDIAMIQIIDADLNKNSDSREIIFSKVYSDSDSSGKIIKLTEMDKIPGIFRGLVSFSTSSSNEKLLVSSGDTVVVEYVDKSLPAPYTEMDTLILSAKTKIFGTKITTSLPHENNIVEKIPVGRSNQLQINSNNDFYKIGDTVTITGKALSDISNINFKVIDPNGDMIKMLQAKIGKNNMFQTSFEIEKQFFPLAGGYEIIAWQSHESKDMDSIPITIGIKGVDVIKKAGVPNWIKNNAEWWAEGAIDDSAFTQGLQFLIKEKVMKVESTSQSSAESKKIPSWVKNNAKWWADGSIDEGSFVAGIEFLVKEGIIQVN
jgi:hypothetical protein